MSMETNHANKWTSKCIQIRSDSIKANKLIA